METHSRIAVRNSPYTESVVEKCGDDCDRIHWYQQNVGEEFDLAPGHSW